jgi:hypothetical protein
MAYWRRSLEHYLDTAHAMDRAEVSINALLPQGWMILGVMGLAPAFLSGRSCEAALAIGLGGMLGIGCVTKAFGQLFESGRRRDTMDRGVIAVSRYGKTPSDRSSRFCFCSGIEDGCEATHLARGARCRFQTSESG